MSKPGFAPPAFLFIFSQRHPTPETSTAPRNRHPLLTPIPRESDADAALPAATLTRRLRVASPGSSCAGDKGLSLTDFLIARQEVRPAAARVHTAASPGGAPSALTSASCAIFVCSLPTGRGPLRTRPRDSMQSPDEQKAPQPRLRAVHCAVTSCWNIGGGGMAFAGAWSGSGHDSGAGPLRRELIAATRATVRGWRVQRELAGGVGGSRAMPQALATRRATPRWNVPIRMR
jgi:hypothetical protein